MWLLFHKFIDPLLFSLSFQRSLFFKNILFVWSFGGFCFGTFPDFHFFLAEGGTFGFDRPCYVLACFTRSGVSMRGSNTSKTASGMALFFVVWHRLAKKCSFFVVRLYRHIIHFVYSFPSSDIGVNQKYEQGLTGREVKRIGRSYLEDLKRIKNSANWASGRARPSSPASRWRADCKRFAQSAGPVSQTCLLGDFSIFGGASGSFLGTFLNLFVAF